MAKKTKNFDSVKLKNDAQEKLMEEYKRREAEFSDFAEFVKSKVDENPWQKEMRRKFGKANGKENA